MAAEKRKNNEMRWQLRIEAAPARWKELDSTQVEAYLRLADMLVEGVNELPSLSEESGLGDSLRRTRTAFLAGGRGTGKTTVLNTLRRDTKAGTGMGRFPLMCSLARVSS